MLKTDFGFSELFKIMVATNCFFFLQYVCFSQGNQYSVFFLNFCQTWHHLYLTQALNLKTQKCLVNRLFVYYLSLNGQEISIIRISLKKCIK